MGNETVKLPDKWSDWEIVEKVGRGSYGTVYKVRRPLMGKELYCAVKIIDIPRDEDELESIRQDYGDEGSVHSVLQSYVTDYIKEIELMANLKGISNIVTIEDFAVEELSPSRWRIYIRMEYLQSFQEYSSAHKMTEKEIIKLATDICSALEYCEKMGIIHRDIKPENIFRSPMGDFKLGDFGIAREEGLASGSYSSKGTRPYMAPEVYLKQHYNISADIYSLGIVLYRLTNRNRYPFENVYKQMISYHEREDALTRRINGEELPKPVDASDELADFILRACTFDPGKRFRSATEMKKALKKLKIADSDDEEENKAADTEENENAKKSAAEENENAKNAADTNAGNINAGDTNAGDTNTANINADVDVQSMSEYDAGTTDSEEEKSPRKIIGIGVVAAILLVGFLAGRLIMHSLLSADNASSSALLSSQSGGASDGNILTEVGDEEEESTSEMSGTNETESGASETSEGNEAASETAEASDTNEADGENDGDTQKEAPAAETENEAESGQASKDNTSASAGATSDQEEETSADIQIVSDTDAEQETETESEELRYKTTGELNVRENASTDYDAIGFLKEGEEVTATGNVSSDGNWIEIYYPDENSTGWVSLKFLEEVSGDAADDGTSETEGEETAPVAVKSSAENTAVYEKYQSKIDLLIDNFVSDSLNTFVLSVGGEHSPGAALWAISGGSCYSSNEAVVTVGSGGKVTAVGEGNAYVVIIGSTGMADIYKYVVTS
ncbi:MAG: protein kinase [Lachnospiraceae bacterium]|nr:protein kinase [Lachnospiraceae bacterium]